MLPTPAQVIETDCHGLAIAIRSSLLAGEGLTLEKLY